jgi:hypothetical protein
VVLCFKKLIYRSLLHFKCILCIGSILVGKKQPSHPILATTIVNYFSGIMELRVPGSFNYLPSWSLDIHCDIYQSSYNISYIIVEFTLSIMVLYPFSHPILGISSTGLIFPFSNTST